METLVIGKNIKAFRERFQLSQDNLAKYLGVQREVISYYESGSRTPTVENLKKLSDFFGVEINDLLEERPDEKMANVAFAFRAEELNENDLDNIAKFRRIVKNYLKLLKLVG